jgi:hypothetical protein
MLEDLAQIASAKNAIGGEFLRGGSSEMTKLSWWR